MKATELAKVARICGHVRWQFERLPVTGDEMLDARIRIAQLDIGFLHGRLDAMVDLEREQAEREAGT